MDQIFTWLFEKKIRFFIVLFFIALFLRISSFNYTFLDVDESQFAGFAHVLMDGGLPYKDSLDTKPPLIYLIYAACFFVFGKYSMVGVHLLSLLISFGVSLTLYRIAKEDGDEKAGLFAALFFAVFSTTYLPKFIATSITSVMILPLALSVCFWLKGERLFRLRHDGLAGFFVGLAFLLKYQAGIQLVVFFFYLVGSFKLKKEEVMTSVIRYLVFLAGFALPVGITFAALWGMGVWPDFVQWSLLGSFKYIQAGLETIPFFHNLAFRGGSFIVSTALIWVLGLEVVRDRGFFRSPSHLLFCLWFLLSLVPVALGGRFYGHYFIQLLPPLCLMAAYAIARRWNRQTLQWTGIFMLIPALFFWCLRVDLKSIDNLFPDDGLFQQQAIGEWIQKNTKPDDTLFVWGFATAIYFHAERKPASRFLWTDLLTGKVPGSEKSNDPSFETKQYAAPKAWTALWEDFEKHPPTYFVDTAPADIHNYKKYPVVSYPELDRFLKEKYRFWKNVDGCLLYRRKM